MDAYIHLSFREGSTFCGIWLWNPSQWLSHVPRSMLIAKIDGFRRVKRRLWQKLHYYWRLCPTDSWCSVVCFCFTCCWLLWSTRTYSLPVNCSPIIRSQKFRGGQKSCFFMCSSIFGRAEPDFTLLWASCLFLRNLLEILRWCCAAMSFSRDREVTVRSVITFLWLCLEMTK